MKISDWNFVAGVSAFLFPLIVLLLPGDAEDAASWARHTIDPSDAAEGKRGADGVRLGDANGDGLLDVVTGWENGDAIRVCLNPGPSAVKQAWPAVTVGKVAGAEDAFFADLDGDGRLDVVSCTEGKTRTVFVHWAPSDREAYLDAAAWKTEAVPALAGKQLWMYGIPFDVNADGKQDLVLGSKGTGATVGWLEHPAGDARDLSRWKYHSLYEAGWIMSLRAVDLDGDGDEDLVFSDRKGPSSGVWWMENMGRAAGIGRGHLGSARCLGFAGEEVMFIDVVDLDGDGRSDIAAALRPGRCGILLQPKAGSGQGGATWATAIQPDAFPQGRFGTAKAVRAGDLDGDGHLDLALTCENAKGALSGVLWAPLRLEAGQVSPRDISGREGVKYDRIELIDLDGDGDLDLMTCEERDNLGVFWYENPSR